jgi:hypothetical protein
MVDFVTLWARMVNASIGTWNFQLRDFPVPMLDIHDFQLFGRLVGAEQIGIERGVYFFTFRFPYVLSI